jgi:FAD/FMN-containing dehydrogenase
VRFARRAFLQAVGVGAVMGATTSCTRRPAAAPPMSTPPSTVPPSTSTAPVPPDWAALRARLPGGLVLPGEPGYDTASHAYNTLFDGHRPAAVATCTRPEDVQACVDVAHKARIPIAARSGGHSYAGYCTPDGGLVADLGKLSSVTVHPDGTAEVGAGTKLIDVYAGLAAAGRCLPAGSCATVGIGGLTLGGGIGVLARKFGLTCDRMVSARVITADAQLRTASAESEPDLFWALRGGGGGNLGIVTSFTFATEPAPDVTVFSLRFPAGAAANVVGAWQQWIAGAPDELWSLCGVTAGSPPTSRVIGCFVGSATALNSLLDNLLAKTSARPSARFVQGKGFLDAMRYFAGCSERTVAQCHPDTGGGQLARNGFVATGLMLPAATDPARLASTVDGRPAMDLLIDSWGGAISRIAPTATAFAHRTALASIQIYLNTTPATQAEASQTLAEVRDAITQLTGPRAYLNYIDPTLPNWATAYYGDNLSRLQQTAHKYDPDAVFAFAQGLTKV